MDFSAAPWHAAQLTLRSPRGDFHRPAPRSTHSVAGLAKSSACIARTSALWNSTPLLGGCGPSAHAGIENSNAKEARRTRGMGSLDRSDHRDHRRHAAFLAAIVAPF